MRDAGGKGHRPLVRIWVLAAVASVLPAIVGAPDPAAADVTSVESSAFGALITPPGTSVSLAEQPSVSFASPPGGPGTQSASQSLVEAPATGTPPGWFFKAFDLAVTTGLVGSLGTHGGGTTSTAFVEFATYLVDQLTASAIRSECTATGDGSSGTASFGEVTFTDQATGTSTVFNDYQPAPNTTFTLLGGLGTVTFNEQTRLDSGQTTGIVVTAMHIRRGLVDIYVGQVRCTATGPDVVVTPPPPPPPPPPQCDLSIVKAMTPSPLVSGQPAVITLTVTNLGTGICGLLGAASDTLVTDAKPPGLTFTGPPTANQTNWNCGLDVSGNAGCASSVFLPSGYTVTFTINGVVTAGVGGNVNNCATVSNIHDTVATNNQSCVSSDPLPAPACDAAATKTMSPVPLVFNTIVTLTVTVANVGGAPCPGQIWLHESLPPTLSFAGTQPDPPGWFCSQAPFIAGFSGGQLACLNPSGLPVGYSITMTFQVYVRVSSGTMTNCLVVHAGADLNSTNNGSCFSADFAPAPATCDLDVEKAMTPDPLLPNRPATITVTVRNVGKAPCGGGQVTTVADPRPSGLSPTNTPLTRSQPGWTCSNPFGGINCTNPAELPPDYEVTFTASLFVTAQGGTVTNCATVSHAADTKATNNQSCVTLDVAPPECDLRVEKFMSATSGSTTGPLIRNQTAFVTVRVVNEGTGACPAGVLTDTAPTGLVFSTNNVSNGFARNCIFLSISVTCDTISINPGASSQFVFRSLPTVPAGSTLTNCVTVAAPTDVDTTNNTGCVTKHVVASGGLRCDLATTKQMTPLVAGETTVVTVRVRNVGTAPCAPGAGGTKLEDSEPVGLSYPGPPPTTPGWSCVLVSGFITCTNTTVTIPVGGSAVFTFEALVTGAAGTVVRNCAVVSSPLDPNSSNDQGCTAFMLVAAATAGELAPVAVVSTTPPPATTARAPVTATTTAPTATTVAPTVEVASAGDEAASARQRAEQRIAERLPTR